MRKCAAFATPVRSGMVLAFFLLLLAGFGLSVAGKERLRDLGETVILELMPVDPRALLLGDYMDLDYTINRTIARALDDNPAFEKTGVWPHEGMAVIRLNPHNLAVFVRLDSGGPLEAGELRLAFRTRDRTVRVGASSFFFEEGFAREYEAAEYGEFRVAPDGQSVLVYLLDEQLKRIEPRQGAD